MFFRGTSLEPSFTDGYSYFLSVTSTGIYVDANMAGNRKGITFGDTFLNALHNGKRHQLGIAINSAGIMSVTMDAITTDDDVLVAPPPTEPMKYVL